MRRPVQLSVAVLAAAAALGACADDRAPDRDATARMFLETCAPGGEPEEVAVCRCAFERIAADLSDEELRALDRSVRGAPDADSIPAEITEAALECASEPLSP